jgi:hypothetical protein
MNSHDHALDDGFDTDMESPWPVLGWIVLAAMVSVVAFLMAPLP